MGMWLEKNARNARRVAPDNVLMLAGEEHRNGKRGPRGGWTTATDMNVAKRVIWQ